MSDPTVNDPFIRWQKYAVEQLGYLNNLLLGIGVATLGFQTNIMYEDSFRFYGFDKILYVCSTSLLLGSIIFGVATGFSRLNDFRITMQITKTQGVKKQQYRELAAKYGDRTWRCFSIQSFGIGLAFLFTGGFYICQFLNKY